MNLLPFFLAGLVACRVLHFPLMSFPSVLSSYVFPGIVESLFNERVQVPSISFPVPLFPSPLLFSLLVSGEYPLSSPFYVQCVKRPFRFLEIVHQEFFHADDDYLAPLPPSISRLRALICTQSPYFCSARRWSFLPYSFSRRFYLNRSLHPISLLLRQSSVSFSFPLVLLLRDPCAGS